MNETISQFESRKREHIELALKDKNEALGLSGLDRIELTHEALPDHNFSDIQITAEILGEKAATPFLVSSMTAGHDGSVNLNQRLARVAAARGWLMGVGSQRRELHDLENCRQEWRLVRSVAPNARLLANLGLAQIIQATDDQLKNLVESLDAVALIVHLNPLQECLQLEGTPHYKGGLQRLAWLVKSLPLPIVVKETGCGLSESTLERLKETGVAAIDVSGFGGTHWGRIEGDRATHNKTLNAGANIKQAAAAETFANWGISTLQSLLNAREVFSLETLASKGLKPSSEIWASGGMRTGLDAAKALALGAQCVGFAKPILQAALNGEEELNLKLETIEHELKVAIFCTGGAAPRDLMRKGVWRVQTEKAEG